MLLVDRRSVPMTHRIAGLSAVVLGRSLTAACHSSSKAPPAASPPAGSSQAAIAASQGSAQPCEDKTQAQSTPAPVPHVAHAPIVHKAPAPFAHAPATGAEAAPPAPAPVAMAAKLPRHHILNCPMDIAGTTAAFVDVHGRPAIVFETPGDVAGLRHRVRAFIRPETTAGIVEPRVSADTQGEGGNEMKPYIAYVATKVRFDDLPGGVRVTYMPVDDGQAASVHQRIAEQVVRLDHGDCSNMHVHGVKVDDIH